MFKKISFSTHSAFKVLDFIHSASTGASAVRPAPVDRGQAAEVITMPRRATPVGGSAAVVIARVTKEVNKLFPQLKGAIRDEMIAAISRQISEDPHASQLMAS